MSAMETLREMVLIENRFREIIERIKVPFGWVVELRFHDKEKKIPYIVIADHDGICNVTGEHLDWEGRPWTMNPNWSDMEIIRTIYKAVLTAVEHEIGERFLVDGVPIYNPHRNLLVGEGATPEIGTTDR